MCVSLSAFCEQAMLSFTSCGARTPPLCATTLNLVRARRAPPATRAPCIPRPRARPALTILCLSICTLGLIYGNNSNSKSKLALLTQSIAYANTLYALILAYLHSTTFFVRARVGIESPTLEQPRAETKRPWPADSEHC